MKQQHIHTGVSKLTQAAKSSVQIELDDRHAKNSQEATERASQQLARENTRSEVEAAMENINARVEELISANPEEFVIRFLQTEGQ